MQDGFILGVITWLSFIFSFSHFSKDVKRFFYKNFVLTDVLSVVVSFMLLTSISKSIVAVIASMTCGLLVNLTLITRNKFCSL